MDKKSYIGFKLLPRKEDRKTDRWTVYSTHTGRSLGLVAWYSAWRRYVYMTEQPLILDAGCLEDIRGFLNKQMENYRKQLRKVVSNE